MTKLWLELSFSVTFPFFYSPVLYPYCLILLPFMHVDDLLMQRILVPGTATTSSQSHSLDSSTGMLNVSGMFLWKKFNQGILYIIIWQILIALNYNILSTGDNHHLLLARWEFICNYCIHLVLFKSCTSLL